MTLGVLATEVGPLGLGRCRGSLGLAGATGSVVSSGLASFSVVSSAWPRMSSVLAALCSVGPLGSSGFSGLASAPGSSAEALTSSAVITAPIWSSSGSGSSSVVLFRCSASSTLRSRTVGLGTGLRSAPSPWSASSSSVVCSISCSMAFFCFCRSRSSRLVLRLIDFWYGSPAAKPVCSRRSRQFSHASTVQCQISAGWRLVRK